MDNSIYPVVVLVGYNRPESMKRLMESVVAAEYPPNHEITLIISLDASDKSDEIERIVNQIPWRHGEKKVIRYKERQGLKKHIISCGNYSKQYGAVIILEDDLFVSPGYYLFTVEALKKYATDPRIAGIALYCHNWNGYSNCRFIPKNNGYDIFLGQFSITWGQCWTANEWNSFHSWLEKQNNEFEDDVRLPAVVARWGKQSWGKFFFKFVVQNNLFYVVPYQSMSTNFSDTGEHNNASNTAHQVPLGEHPARRYCFPEFQSAIKYDAFFERVLSKCEVIDGICGSEICMDLNDCRRVTNGERYLISTRKLPYNVVKSYGIKLRPIEDNIMYNISGNDIILYDINKQIIDLPCVNISNSRTAYEMYGIEWDRQIKFGIYTFMAKVRKKLLEHLGKR